jgi:hypothetical protein
MAAPPRGLSIRRARGRAMSGEVRERSVRRIWSTARRRRPDVGRPACPSPNALIAPAEPDRRTLSRLEPMLGDEVRIGAQVSE